MGTVDVSTIQFFRIEVLETYRNIHNIIIIIIILLYSQPGCTKSRFPRFPLSNAAYKRLFVGSEDVPRLQRADNVTDHPLLLVSATL